MNHAVITKIEFRILGNNEFSILEIIPDSGKLKQDPQQTRAGTIYTTVIDASVAKINEVTDNLLKSLNNRKAQFLVTDANDVVYMVGDDRFPARMIHQSALDGTPGSFGGYRVTITLKSPTGYTIQ